MAAPSSVDEHLSRVPAGPRAVLEELRAAITAIAPGTTETISYRMPTFRYRGRALVGIAAFTNHCSLFPYSRKVIAVLEEELRPYDTSGKGGTIRFTAAEPLPAALVEKIVRTRIEEIEARARR